MLQHTPSQDLAHWFDAQAMGKNRPLLVIGGPCVLETDAINKQIAHCLAESCADLGLPFVFKASFDKANRSSIGSERGPGIEVGLDAIAAIGEEINAPTCTDIHLPEHAAAAASRIDLLQIPAFLCRQTDLLAAAGETGSAVNVKKGQFMAPAEMANVLEKLSAAGAKRMMVTERGTFFGYNRLVNDFAGLGDLMDIANERGASTCFDITHSTQLPGGEGATSGGRPERADLLARAAAASGVDAIFLECHPNPATGSSDRATMLPLGSVPGLLRRVVRIRKAALT